MDVLDRRLVEFSFGFIQGSRRGNGCVECSIDWLLKIDRDWRRWDDRQFKHGFKG
jgi:hypothetical protein